MPGNEKIIAFAVHPGATPLDLVGPRTILRGTGRPPHRTVVVGERLEEVGADTPLRLRPIATLVDVPDRWAAIVPGGGPATTPSTANWRNHRVERRGPRPCSTPAVHPCQEAPR